MLMCLTKGNTALNSQARTQTDKLVSAGIQLGAMYLTADGATQDEAIGALPTLPYPVGPNQYTPITMLTLEPPKYDVQVGHCARRGSSS